MESPELLWACEGLFCLLKTLPYIRLQPCFRGRTDYTCPKENLGSLTNCLPIEQEIHYRRVNFQHSTAVSILSLLLKKTSFYLRKPAVVHWMNSLLKHLILAGSDSNVGPNFPLPVWSPLSRKRPLLKFSNNAQQQPFIVFLLTFCSDFFIHLVAYLRRSTNI